MTTSKSHAAKKPQKKVRPAKARHDRSEKERSTRKAAAARPAREAKGTDRKHAKAHPEKHPERAESALELADLFCRQARRRADVLFEELWHNDDDLNTKRAFEVLDGRYDWVEEGV